MSFEDTYSSIMMQADLGKIAYRKSYMHKCYLAGLARGLELSKRVRGAALIEEELQHEETLEVKERARR